MENHFVPEGNPVRIIIRAHERWLDEYQSIVDDWFRHRGYATATDSYAWPKKHHVHILGINNRRFHLIIDMHKECLKDPEAEELSYELYRLRKPNESKS